MISDPSCQPRAPSGKGSSSSHPPALARRYPRRPRRRPPVPYLSSSLPRLASSVVDEPTVHFSSRRDGTSSRSIRICHSRTRYHCQPRSPLKWSTRLNLTKRRSRFHLNESHHELVMVLFGQLLMHCDDSARFLMVWIRLPTTSMRIGVPGRTRTCRSRGVKGGRHIRGSSMVGCRPLAPASAPAP
jgi:hypothetical protein